MLIDVYFALCGLSIQLTLSWPASTNTKNYSIVATAVPGMAVNCAEMNVNGSNNGSEAQKIELTLFCYFIDQ